MCTWLLSTYTYVDGGLSYEQIWDPEGSKLVMVFRKMRSVYSIRSDLYVNSEVFTWKFLTSQLISIHDLKCFHSYRHGITFRAKLIILSSNEQKLTWATIFIKSSLISHWWNMWYGNALIHWKQITIKHGKLEVLTQTRFHYLHGTSIGIKSRYNYL